jgi:ADP-dependent NAD(P)H-hydrate dehydratase / NAD(P)H-hydrate epimerase
MMHRILTVDQMREADRSAIERGTPGITLMERAGAAVAEHVRDGFPAARNILVLCGPGNNGGDGFVAARLLAGEGLQVRLALLGSPEALSGDAATAAAAWAGDVLDAAAVDPARGELVVDALFGTGLTRDLDGAAAALVSRVNRSQCPVLAVDIPSGIDGDTGRVRGVAIEADATVTFAARRPGHLLLPGRTHCGRVDVADIGIADEILASLEPHLSANGPDLWLEAFPRPAIDTHKYERGHALVLSGDATHTGAARLVARGALRVGAGAVTLASPRSALAVNAAHLTAVMLSPCDNAEELASLLSDKRINVVAMGPGIGAGERTRGLVKAAAKAGRALVLDADALTSFSGEAYTLGAISTSARECVLTPHQGEMSRLFESAEGVLDAPSKLEAALRAARIARSVLVFKGADTVVASPDGRAAIASNGSPYLATAGAGDVLAGIIAGLLAQGMPAYEAACAAVWLHGEAGARFGAGLIAEDIPDLLPRALATLITP